MASEACCIFSWIYPGLCAGRLAFAGQDRKSGFMILDRIKQPWHTIRLFAQTEV